jgi:hypothetical protein
VGRSSTCTPCGCCCVLHALRLWAGLQYIS